MNYLRLPIEQKLGLETEEQIDSEAFDRILKRLIASTNDLASADRNENLIAIETAIDENINAVILDIDNTRFDQSNRAKRPIFNVTFNKLNINGITSPFFHEIHYNADLIECELPFAIAHEKAHLRGYNREADANFIAYLTCINSDSRLCRYSGNFSIVAYFLRQVRSKKVLDETWQALSPAVKEDFRKVRDRVSRNRGMVSNLHSRVNDVYLKLNQVEAGVRDYSRVVKLVVAFETSRAAGID